MKQSRTFNLQPFAFIRMAVRSGLVLLSLNAGLVAQSADIFESKSATETGEGAAETKEKLTPPAPVDTQPSRFVGQDVEAYVAARAAVFSMRNRATDPFGLYQDPNLKPVVPKLDSNVPSKRQAALPPTPLVEILKLIRVTTIMPGEKRFLVGVRSFQEDGEFTMVFQGKTMRMKVIKVTSNRIVFRDLDKGEEAAMETGMLPPGMVIAGGKDMKPPGMVSPLENSPLRLESGVPDEN